MPFPKVQPSKFTYQISKEWGQIYWFDFGQAMSHQRTFAEPHPAVIISNPKVTLPGTILIVPFTSLEHKRPGYEFHVDITKEDCAELDKDSVAKVDQVYCVEENLLPDQYFIGVLRRSAIKRMYSKLLKALAFQNVI
ncbi:MAG: type II toxin-antitoxin system PemK/MazF family toxin [Dehalococcoidia bacterium]|nr:MAG: type II toxin-antitoxin system PemK/MazF family toxin [Dehalococcoidia bacterium]